ncbi:MAG: hypothetical protein WC766_02470 [Patescibacteria group bacterium]|jgi:hypothetical protein
MSEVKSEEFCTSDTPEGLIRTLNIVARLAEDIPDEEALKTRFTGRGECFEDALNVAQQACPKVDWIRQARVRWLRLAMHAWGRRLERMERCSPSEVNVAMADINHPPLGMNHLIVTTHITVCYLGADCNEVMNEYLALLQKIYQWTDNWYWGREMVKLILRRTGCARPNDPHRDEAACHLLLRQYGLRDEIVVLDE